MKRTGTLLLLACILYSFSVSRSGATIYHSNGSAASVQALHNSAHEGDTITLPAGTFSWTSGVKITKGITLLGETTTDPVNKTANDRTIILDNVVRRGGGTPIIRVQSALGKSYRLSGITFSNGTVTAHNYNGFVKLLGTSQTVRVDHCHFNNLTHQASFVRTEGSVYGVIDHNLFDYQAGKFPVDFYNGGPNGDPAWAAPAYYGSSQFMFVEDNAFNVVGGGGGSTDDFDGARWVFRYNHCYDTQVQTHGTECCRDRGGRAREVYNNDFHFSFAVPNFAGIRSGGLITHDNSVYGAQPNHGAIMQVFRMFFKFPNGPWGGASGDNPWDSNDPVLYQSGTVSSGSQTTLTDTTKNWSPNQWVGYTAKRLSDNGIAQITSNTRNTLRVMYYTDSGGGVVWAAGDQYQIHKVLAALDQPGRGGGDLVIGDRPINRRTGTPAWPQQALEPCYSWNDRYVPTNALLDLYPKNSRELVAGRDFYNNTPMPGYTPFVYPHPLVTGLSGAGVIDFNGDSHPDFVLYNANTGQTAVWYMDNNVRIGNAYGPTVWPGWNVVGAADFNLDGHPDYLLFNPITRQTAIWYLDNNVRTGSAFGPTVWVGWSVAGVADFNGDGQPDYLLFNPSTAQTAIWYLDNNVRIGSAFGPTVWVGWSVAGVADFNRDGQPDYLLSNPNTGQTATWYLDNNVRIGSAFGPTVWVGWSIAGVADFNRDGQPDYLLFNPITGQTAIWYLNNNVRVGSAFSSTAGAGWSFVAP